MKRLIFLQSLGCLLFAVFILGLYKLGVFSPISVIGTYIFLGIGNVINARLVLMKPIEDISIHDKLTGCYNRTKLDAKIQEYDKYSEYAVIFFDINNLKRVNDDHGHDIGDKMLITASEQLRFWHRYGDLYRIGGDEFIVVVSNMSNKRLETIVQKWYSEQPALNEGLGDEFVCGFSYGIFYKMASIQMPFKSVMDNADKKMYEMKRIVKGKISNPH